MNKIIAFEAASVSDLIRLLYIGSAEFTESNFRSLIIRLERIKDEAKKDDCNDPKNRISPQP